MKRAALAVAPHPSELENRARPCDQQPLHRELRTGMQPQSLGRPVRVVTRRFKRAQMHLLSRHRYCVRRLNLKIAAVQKETPDRSGQSRASTEEWQPAGK